jgi:outer membrane protein TolC
MNKLFSLIVSLLISAITLNAQEKTLTLENVLSIVRKYHPVVLQSALQIEQASNSLLASRGVFDPAIQINNERKTFDSKQYFNYYNPELKIPTWYGVDFKAGLENNIGQSLDPSFTLNKSSYVGVSLDPFKGLIYDKRRAAVQQAAAMVKLSKQEQRVVVNDLLFEATDAYWNWVNTFLVQQVLAEVVQNNISRFEFVKQAFQFGDRASIDTIEALAQLQSVQSLRLQADLDLQKARFLLSNYFWNEENQPYVFGGEVIPDTLSNQFNPGAVELPNLSSLLNRAMVEHPKLISFDNKRDFLEIEKKVKTLELLPSFKMSYNFLNKGYALADVTKQALFQNNYKYGVSFGLPLLQRQARGELSKTKNKIAEIDYGRKLSELEIQNKVRAAYAESTLLLNQLTVFQQNFINNKKLLEAENAKFTVGESSMFLVNAREMKLIETQQKLISLKTKFFKSIIANQWAAGLLR